MTLYCDLYNTDPSLVRARRFVDSISILKRFDCSDHGDRFSPDWSCSISKDYAVKDSYTVDLPAQCLVGVFVTKGPCPPEIYGKVARKVTGKHWGDKLHTWDRQLISGASWKQVWEHIACSPYYFIWIQLPEHFAVFSFWMETLNGKKTAPIDITNKISIGIPVVVFSRCISLLGQPAVTILSVISSRQYKLILATVKLSHASNIEPLGKSFINKTYLDTMVWRARSCSDASLKTYVTLMPF